MDGIIVVKKEKGMSSFDVIRSLRKILQERKIGHTGTLDPLATGVLILCVGKATRLAQEIEAEEKIYEAEMEFGYQTDTYDLEGKVLVESLKKEVSREEFEKVLEKWKGDILQIPPMYSAIKLQGKKLYELARKGVEVERDARKVTVFEIHTLEFQQTKAKILTKVSKGTYIRSLIHDIGKDLGSFATMTALNRIQVGEHTLKNAYTISEIHDKIKICDFSFCIPVEEYFLFPKIQLEGEKNRSLFQNGNTVIFQEKDGKYRVYQEEVFLGLGKIEHQRLKGYKYF
ncbi:tRNA pseudouridine(55) synthase TruB [Fusobacterium necrophorum]|uniref:tRNA pseudouridine synthase B n=1 Tax=Fusobacterium necrophorum DJ-2 TaxID=1441737 RepID=A0AB73C3E0_9FUSO|nr:tRNA pseudouridine(55) synthase TruB [Fusobacterium necrophorum]KDE65679.1 tRNA pseudouridine synthase B [Fusobacterium necrophorum DJ-1]KDE67081.1 tRNA pseudouridine synthase B [Fusobacterium necrophorum BFTR-1]KDE72287.1 tRNA pseudouridine synthase B [Fusobacterium necrophorum DJ-2]MBR8733519.1 tRNA pseudouridine synthase B [Fusobacterium necrophorum]MBR8789652.1 tRNA pseudouridine synthase B [Fusobacterium necrophorum]